MPGDVTSLPDRSRKVTLAKWLMGKPLKGRDGELAFAFERTENLKDGIRRLTASEWMAEFSTWRDTPHG